MANAVRILISLAVLWQLLRALTIFTRTPERRLGLGSISLVAYATVLFGARNTDLFTPAAIPGVIAIAASLALFEWARLTIRGLKFSYISSTDVPQFVCTDGPFHWIRHPFYTSYLMVALSVTVMFPNPVTVIAAIVTIIAFTFAARYEESKFEASPVAAEYAAYKQRTGRFFPYPR